MMLVVVFDFVADDTCRSLCYGKGVSAQLGLDEEVCGMHDGDKIGQYVVGGLVRTSHKVNPFPERQELMKKAHRLGTYFSYITRHSQLMLFRQQHGIPKTMDK